MEIDLKKIAALSRLHIDDADYPLLKEQMTQIILRMEQMPLPEDSQEELSDAEMILREDNPTPFDTPELLTQNAPKMVDGYFSIPKTVD